MKQIPSTLVVSALFLIVASWPSVESWGDANLLHHYWVHGLYLIGGGLSGLQASIWARRVAAESLADDPGVSS